MIICTKCGKKKKDDAFAFANKQKGWRRHECKDCRRTYFKKWAAESKEHLRKEKKRWYEDHREQILSGVKKWVQENPEKRKRNALNYYYRLQKKCIEAYGGYKCACCGEKEPMFLTLDHMNDDGGEQRKRQGFTGGTRFYKWLIAKRFPSGFQVLCMNCNQGRYRNGGICPHKKRRMSPSRSKQKREGRA